MASIIDGSETSHGALRCAATTWTVQPVHSDGVSHDPGGRSASASANRIRSAATNGKTSIGAPCRVVGPPEVVVAPAPTRQRHVEPRPTITVHGAVRTT